MFNNPLIERYRYSQLRPRQFWIYLVIYTIVISLMLLINWSIYNYQHAYESRHGFFRGLYYQFLMFQLLILWVWGAVNSGSALKEEIIQKSYDFFRMIPLSAHDKVAGIVLGKNLVTLLFAAVNSVFLLLFGCLGFVNILLQIQVAALLVAGAILWSLAALLSSTSQNKKRQTSGFAVMVLGGMFLFPFLLSGVMALSEVSSLELVCIKFFSAGIPALGLFSLLALYFSGWIYQGCLRQLTLEREPLFTSRGAIMFMVGYVLIVLGFFWPHLLNKADYMTDSDLIRVGYGMWVVSFLPLVLIPLGSLKSFDKYMEEAGTMPGKKCSGRITSFSMLRSSNLGMLLCLFWIWTMVALVAARMAGIGLTEAIHFMFVLFSFYLFFVLLLEIHVVYSPVYSKIQILIGFIVLVQVILPIIMGAVCSSNAIYLFSPLGFAGEIFAGENIYKWMSTLNMVLALNLMLSAISLGLVAQRYIFITTSRRAM